MISLNFGLFWSGGDISYLRYLTLASLRKFHPDSQIDLYMSKEFLNDGVKWGCEKQDFQYDQCEQHVSIEDIEKLDVNIKSFDAFENYTPNYQSDFFRWWWLKEHGGFYLDMDQIILKSFAELDLDYDLITTRYKLSWGAAYYPVGVLGAVKTSEIVDYANDMLVKYYNPNDYNSLGPWGFRSVYNLKTWRDKVHFTPSQYFYPIPESQYMPVAYENSIKLPEDVFAFHWYGGLPQSQEFNRIFTREFAEAHDDTVSNIVRENNFFE